MNFGEIRRCRPINKLNTRSMLNIWIPLCDQKYSIDIFVYFKYDYLGLGFIIEKKPKQPISNYDYMTEIAT